MSKLKHVLIITTLLLSGCSWLKRPQPAENLLISKKARQERIQAMNAWTAEGAISITYKTKTDMGSFSWKQKGLEYDLHTYGPLHMAGVRITGSPGRVRLWKTSKHSVSAITPEHIMKREIGWYLPLSNFRYWTRGIPAPKAPSKQEFDHFGHLISLNQQGWNITYQKFQSVQGVDLPHTIVFSHDPIRVKMVIKSWAF